MAGSVSTGEEFAVGSASSRLAVSVAGGSVSALELVSAPITGPQHCSVQAQPLTVALSLPGLHPDRPLQGLIQGGWIGCLVTPLWV